MKLYATVTSERASKGQGGNNFLDIVLQVGDAKTPHTIGMITLTQIKGHWLLRYGADNTEEWQVLAEGEITTGKGEQKKGDICKLCGRVHKNDTAICE